MIDRGTTALGARPPLVTLPALEQRLSFMTEAVIFGAGSAGQQARARLEEHGVAVRAFVDNNESLRGQRIDGLEVVPAERLCGSSITVVIASLWADQIWPQLWELGVRDVCVSWGDEASAPPSGPPPSQALASWHLEDGLDPGLRLVLRDLVRPGQTVFQLGARDRTITRALSRLVGPRGVVCAFESSGRHIPRCQSYLTANVHLFHLVAARSSRDSVPVYLAEDWSRDGLRPSPTSASFDEAPAASLDEFVRFFDLHPALVRVGPEHADAAVFEGAWDMLCGARPHLLVTLEPAATRCVSLLLTAGYRAWDIQSYEEVTGPSVLGPRHQPADLVFVHESSREQLPWRTSSLSHDTMAVDLGGAAADAGAICLPPVHVEEPARMLLTVEFDGQATRSAVVEVSLSGRPWSRASYQVTGTSQTARIPIDVPRASSIACRVSCGEYPPAAPPLRSATLRRVGPPGASPFWLK